jgi:xanthine/CO dehydrogenase XdhC/CoxF family maturation factor
MLAGVLFPTDMKELSAVVNALLASDGQPSVLATLVSVAGSSYRRPGARMLIRRNAPRIGSISGGCLEEDVLARATRVMESGKADVVVYDTTSENDLVWGVGLGCHGIVRVLLERLPPQPAWAAALAKNFKNRRSTALAITHGGTELEQWGTRLAAPGDCASPDALFLETVPPPPALLIFGAGDDAQPLARLAAELGWNVTIADPRPSFATSERFPVANALVVGAADALVARADPGPEAFAVVMTHHYVHDVPILRDLITRPLAYLGLLGPRKRAEKILGDLAAAGLDVTPAQRARLHAPVGLDLGADSPDQVALSIVAEIQATVTGHNARPLRERTRPIHE